VRALKRLVIIVVLIFVLVIGVLFSIQNTLPVPLDLLLIQLPEQPIALWLFLFLAFGGISGVSLGLVAIIRLKAHTSLLRRRVEKLEQELVKQRAADFRLPVDKS